MQDGDEYTLRVNVTEGDYYRSDTIMVYYVAPSGAHRILEDGIVNLCGIMHCMYSYESVLGAAVTAPLMEALYVEKGNTKFVCAGPAVAGPALLLVEGYLP